VTRTGTSRPQPRNGERTDRFRQDVQINCHQNRAMDNGLTQPQASEIFVHIAFYAGWRNAFSALPVVKEVFKKRQK
jgi:4-carboxymuconolactone decarboxylase